MNQTHDHIVKSFDSELARLNAEIARMGQLAAEQLRAAMHALQNRDEQAADQVIAKDHEIDQMERTVAHDALKLLVLRQPMARDLREVYAALRVSADIERIGDYASNIAKRSKVISAAEPMRITAGMLPLAQMALDSLEAAMRAYRERNDQQAMQVRARDAEIDALYTTLFRGLLTYMAEDTRKITACTQLMFLGKDIERVGDHSTNICESVWFLVNGEMLSGAREKADLTAESRAE